MSNIKDTFITKSGDLRVNKLEKYLKHNCISQRGFAKKLATTPNNLNRLVQGKGSPSIRMAYKIEKLTGGLVNLYDWVLDEEETLDHDEACLDIHTQSNVKKALRKNHGDTKPKDTDES